MPTYSMINMYIYALYIHVYIYCINVYIFIYGKRKSVLFGRQTINGNRQLLFQQTCPSRVIQYICLYIRTATYRTFVNTVQLLQYIYVEMRGSSVLFCVLLTAKTSLAQPPLSLQDVSLYVYYYFVMNEERELPPPPRVR